MKIVITGGAGFIGSYIAEYFASKSYVQSIDVIDKMTYAAHADNLKYIQNEEKVCLHQFDILDQDKVRELIKEKEVVIHAAAESHVDNSFESSILFTKSNTLGTHSLLEECKKAEVRKFIHISTDEVYGENNTSIPHNENSNFQPSNPYSASKAGAEMIVKSYIESYDMNIVIFRANNMYGSRQFPEKLIPKTICRLLQGKKAEIHGNGNNKRTFLHPLDFSRALEIAILEQAQEKIFNVGSVDEYRNIDIVKLICEKMNKDFDKSVKFIKDRPFNDSRYYIDYKKIQSYGWNQERHIYDDLDEIIEWYVKNLSRYQIT
tara:strand:- start:9843 stop:10799 length:957 start_codon:yes stop_codon:yes gene_type:complete